MVDTGESILLKSTFEIRGKLYSVKLTSTELYWESLDVSRTPVGPYSQPLVNSSFASDCNADDSTHVNTLSLGGAVVCNQIRSFDEKCTPIIQVTDPERSPRACGSGLACCSVWHRPPAVIKSCNSCGKPIKAENQVVKISDVLAVRIGDVDERSRNGSVGVVELIPVGTTEAFTVWTARPHGRHRWRCHRIVFHSKDSNVTSQWVDALNESIGRPEHNRPRSILVFVNPVAGRGRAVRIYQEKVAPLFELAGIKTYVVHTERQRHACEYIQSCSLESVNGIVTVGGDGMFAEAVEGLLNRTLKDSGVTHVTSETVLLQPKLRIGIIPAGSTDTVSYSTQGLNDVVTSAIHIILGDNLAMDVGTVFRGGHFVRYNISFLGYGYYGEILQDGEDHRWMGPKRYEWAGFKKVLSNQTYEGEIQFLPSECPESHPRDGIVCGKQCETCQQTSHRLKQSLECPTVGVQDVRWKTVRGRFIALNSFLISCRCRYATEGPAPNAHIGDGCADLVMIGNCSRFDFTRHLMRCADRTADQFDFPFIQVHRITRFRFVPSSQLDNVSSISGSGASQSDNYADASDVKINSVQHLHETARNVDSIWNCDGEVITEPTLEFRVHPQVIRLFARGIDDEVHDFGSGCVCCLSNQPI